MKLRNLALFTIGICNINTTSAQSEIIFKAGFEDIRIYLNDTGVIWASEYPTGNNADCTSSSIISPQDCKYGRDVFDKDPIDGHAGFSFTKLDSSGNPLVDQSVIYDQTPWACVLDNVTNLVWEVKSTAEGIHNKDNTYLWGGITAIGREHPGRLGVYHDPSWNELVEGSNIESLCGFDNWRLPNVAELSSIVNKNTFNPAIDSNFFPNTGPFIYWSSSPYVNSPSNAWVVIFGDGNDSNLLRNLENRVRLVRSVE